MITESINVHSAPGPSFKQQQQKKYTGKVGGDDHRKYIHQRTYDACIWEIGDKLLYKRNPVEVIDVIDTLEDVEWDGLSACIVEVWDYGQDHFCVHPNDLKRAKK